ncbi:MULTISPECIES: DUF2252 family protein [Rhodopseudomonas]|uniref:DUF2252 domain-containing protein n=1 Tax=Rhodopseudomonas palustris TaxID=1076 RepID=A0A0D7F5G3_RHOPL|nr:MULTISPECIES: DUF2252 family protein [Rhodopseudomonas]KIZ48016.1 hypothetical protein OO17_01220 [Rhodopseudomonas palustris]MDF3811753.1 DUF2252 family protein [Rhodopseudomonas sp. BAL398]WOK16561.1 DUF2252 family protein [Rhodopseudomonas sp. BAL398]
MSRHQDGSFRKDNAAYEAWLRMQCEVVGKDVRHKHAKMKENAFIFLRATYFRWAKTIPTLCPELMDAPAVLSVGDMHLENFGTWRDAEGRLVWGVNDFDEAAMMPYPLDLLRLATSVRLAPRGKLKKDAAGAALLKGYRAGLAQPRPALLDESDTWMLRYAVAADKTSDKFWAKVAKYPTADPPRKLKRHLVESLPKHATNVCYFRRVAGTGSLGRPRYVAVADWRGGRVLREAKALVSSAWVWAHGEDSASSHFLELATGRYRASDPLLEARHHFVIRRLAPDSRKIELGRKVGTIVRTNLLWEMGYDLGSIHAAGSPGAKVLLADLKRRKRGWLNAAAKTAAAAVRRDYAQWCG